MAVQQIAPIVKTEAGVLPNLVIAGVVKGGTTSVFTYLSQHPDICPSSKKETCYFLPVRYGGEPAPVTEYLLNFKRYRTERYVMEATPGYFEGGYKLASLMRQQLGQARIVMILREPVERLFSFYNYQKAMLNISKDMIFDRYIKLCENIPYTEVCKQTNDPYWGIQGGFYANYMNDWFEVFPDSIRVFFFDQIKRDPALLLAELYDWLGVEAVVPETLRVENKTISYKVALLHKAALAFNMKAERVLRLFPDLKDAARRLYFTLNGQPFEERMSSRTRSYLESVYAPYNERLAHQLAKRGYSNMPTWLVPPA
ncbi:sulfotransferase family protein [Gloeobacter violaceus]|uniref:Glr0464 protein n=1 Tax=Gloeobacter violaceus (strain ATCC 29082 / PCC 7421) TaxID=251221 RepID=Q7NNE7_GLOVI|nr:sulfotransferase domain-containing protein [Gloeobacter violaceus]BAC88405.1 glr0464 [Gloeobacter violaceus PCC 7421]